MPPATSPNQLGKAIEKLPQPARLALAKAILAAGSGSDAWSIEPDSLPCAGECGELQETVGELQQTISDLNLTIDALNEAVASVTRKANETTRELGVANERIAELEAAQALLKDAKPSRQKRVRGNQAPESAPAAKKAKSQLTKEEAVIRDKLQKRLKATVHRLIGFDKNQHDGKMPGKSTLGEFAPSSPDGAEAYMLPDWSAASWCEGSNFDVVDQTITVVQEESKKSPLKEGEEAWLTHDSLKSILHPIWNAMKRQFEAEHDSHKKARMEKWALEGRLSERRNTRYSWMIKGATLQAHAQEVPEEDVEGFAVSIVDEFWVGEEWGWEDQDEDKRASWWEEMGKSGELSAAQKRDCKSAFELRRPEWMSDAFWMVCKSFVYLKEEDEINNPVRKGKHPITARIDLGNKSNLKISVGHEPYAFMVDATYLLGNPGFKIRDRPETISDRMANDMSDVRGPWVHPSLYDS
ncbi:hypothetical protein CALCODRAFT_510343 [Calocera cornea HHB12733]|uniref:Uncharacterized protein n=1 Tax=Calocera cornea HHB12733 TaxID=1353952 RepID=A0A165ELS8_9BASI|nr:hypothetical protein CALCODRAFT_510343 [Calocera cornea HHB12733]